MQNIRTIAPLPVDFLFARNLVFWLLILECLLPQGGKILMFTLNVRCLCCLIYFCLSIGEYFQISLKCLDLVLCYLKACRARWYVVGVWDISWKSQIICIVHCPITGEYAHKVGVWIDRAPRSHFFFSLKNCYCTFFVEFVVDESLSSLI